MTAVCVEVEGLLVDMEATVVALPIDVMATLVQDTVVVTPLVVGAVGPMGPPGAGWPMIVSPTPPTAADFGGTIPLLAVWVQSPP